MTLQDTDNFLVQRDTTPYKVESQNFSSLQDDDLFVVSRNGQNYKLKASEMNLAPKEEPPSVDSVSLIESNPGKDPRFTDQTFVASSQVTEFPVAEKTIDAHVDGTLSKQVQFDEPLESKGSVETSYGDLLSAAEPGAIPITNANNSFNANISNYGIVSDVSPSTEYTVEWDIPAELKGAGDWNFHLRRSPGSETVLYVMRDVGVESLTQSLNSNEAGQAQPGWCFSDITVNADTDKFRFKFTTGPGDTTVNLWASIRKDGVELVGSTTSETLVFPANADMEGLAAGDTVNQTIGFSEPLENFAYRDFSYNSTLSRQDGWNGAIPDGATADGAFDGLMTGNNSSWATNTILGTSPIYQEVTIPGVLITSPYLLIKAQNYSSHRDFNLKLNGNTFLVYLPTQNQTNVQIDISSMIGETITTIAWGRETGNPGSALSSIARIWAFSFNNIATNVYENTLILPPEGGLEPQLEFAAGTDMSKLAPGDDVSQTPDGLQPDYQTAGEWIYTETGAGAWGTLSNPGAAFDGRTTWAFGSNAGNNCQLTKTFVPGIKGATLTITGLAGLTSTYTYSINDGPDISWTPWGDDTDISIPGGTLNSLKITRVTSKNTEAPAWPTISAVDGMVLISNGTIPAPLGTVGSITDTTATLSSSSGTWVNGVDVTNTDKTTSGTVESVTGTTATLSSSTGAWVAGEAVVGPQKTITEDNTRLYCAFDSNGNVTDLQNTPQDPPYKTTNSNPNLLFTFPATFPSGQTPDEELPDGTTFTVEVSATNTQGTSGPVSATVQPAVSKIQFNEPLESQGTVTTPDQNGSSLTTPVANGGALDPFFTENGSITMNQVIYSPGIITGIRCTLTAPIENVKTLHMVWGRQASIIGQYWKQYVRVGINDPWIECDPYGQADTTQDKINWPGSIDVSSQIPSNGIVTTFEFAYNRWTGTGGGANQYWGGLVVNGKTVISSESLTALTFADGTDMSTLASDDTVNQDSATGTVGSITDTTVNLDTSTGSWVTAANGGANVIGPDKTSIRSLTEEELEAQKLKFLTYGDRRDVKVGEKAKAQIEEVFKDG